MYNNKSQWFSQVLLSYKDKVYATDGYLRVSLSTSTEDFKFYNQPTLNISISNNYQKSINLNIQNAKDLLRAFNTILKQMNGTELNIQRKYQKDTLIHFTFKTDQNNNRIVVIEIRSNESDFSKIVIPLESVFESFASTVKGFTENYMSICSQLFIQSIQAQCVQTIHQIPSLIKGISSQIISNTNGEIESSNIKSPEVDRGNYELTQSTIEDLDKFLGDDMENINVPEIEKEVKANVVEVDSIFVKHYLKNKLENIESNMSQLFMSKSPLLSFVESLNKNLKQYVSDENFSILKNISDHELKSLVYISGLFSNVSNINYFESSVPLPASTPVLKYKVSDYSDENLSISYDLFLFNLYLRNIRRRLESKIEDAVENKALFYIQFRFITDPIVFSYLDKIDKTKISSIILSRYKYYDSIGVFDYYKNLLIEKNCPNIIESDILSNVEEAVDKVIGSSAYITDLHNNLQEQNSLRIKSKSDISLEQIINEYIPLEVAEKIGKDLTKSEVIDELKLHNELSDEVIKIFQTKKTKINEKITDNNNKKTSNLERVIRSQFIDEVPEQYRTDFLQYLLDLGDNKFDFNNVKFPIDEFGDNVVKALYLWDPQNDAVVSKNYKQFYIKIEEELMERDLILAKVKTVESKQNNSEWDFLNI